MEKNSGIDIGVERTCIAFLQHEAECLDDRRFNDWLALLDPNIDYKAPVRTTRENWDGTGISRNAFYLDEDYPSLKMRVQRLASKFAWSENPATRTRRFVGNVRVGAKAGHGDMLELRSNLAIFCYRGEAAHPQIITAERFDDVRLQGGMPLLVKRTAILDAAVLGLESLSIFL